MEPLGDLLLFPRLLLHAVGMAALVLSDEMALLENEVAAASDRLATAEAHEIVAWAVERFGDGLLLAASFQDCVLIDVATRVCPEIEVVFLDTQFHFEETLEYVRRVQRRYRLNLRVERPVVTPDEWPCGTDRCCRLRKVEPLNRALAGKRAWMSGIRRAEGGQRSRAPVAAVDRVRGVVKVNPLVMWSDPQVDRYVAEHALPVHPLRLRGYESIGCAPTTVPTRRGQPSRAGRWPGTDKTECGIHV